MYYCTYNWHANELGQDSDHWTDRLLEDTPDNLQVKLASHVNSVQEHKSSCHNHESQVHGLT